jgi:hypothetical protein
MCKSIDEKYEKICEIEKNPRFCQFCEGVSGLTREKEIQFLEIRLKQINNIKNEPNLLQKTSNFIQAGLGHILSGMKSASPELIEQRNFICSDCEKYNPQKDSCSECGCFLSIKTIWSEQKCPLGKW